MVWCLWNLTFLESGDGKIPAPSTEAIIAAQEFCWFERFVASHRDYTERGGLDGAIRPFEKLRNDDG